MSETKPIDKDLWKLKRYLHVGFETLEILKTGDDLRNLTCLISLIKNNYGCRAVEIIKRISIEGNLSNRQFLITALAVCARQSYDMKTKSAAYEILRVVCLNPFHLFTFLSKCEHFGFLMLNAGELQAPENLTKKTKTNDSKTQILNETKESSPRITSAKKEPNKNIENTDVITPHRTTRIASANKEAPSSSTNREHISDSRISSAKKESHKNSLAEHINEKNENITHRTTRIASAKKEASSPVSNNEHALVNRISSANKEIKSIQMFFKLCNFRS